MFVYSRARDEDGKSRLERMTKLRSINGRNRGRNEFDKRCSPANKSYLIYI